jgi:hypothetical protein
MYDRLSIDEIRDMAKQLKKHAEYLYRYADPGRSMDLFNKLSAKDKLRLLYWVFTQEDDRDIKAVANHLMAKFDEKLSDLEELLDQLRPEDKAEIDDIGSQLRTKKLLFLSAQDKARIGLVLSQAREKLGPLEVEEAYWVLLPSDPIEPGVWISARGRATEISSFVRLPDSVDYDPDKDELYNLYGAMRRASWVLHIHNHPNSLTPEPSSQDRAFVRDWKTRRPELSGKLKFFVIGETEATEYT